MTRHRLRRAAIRNPGPQPFAALLRPIAAMVLLTLLAACAGTPRPALPVAEEAADYRAHARSYYAPPGPPGDPWGPYIDEASKRFDVPAGWIRAVMHQESGGHEFINGQFVVSVPGAMGLMQLMPPTYDDMRTQYGLGPDPYDPHDNILAGTAYIRQMYDIYGSPGFLAAYNTGPGRLDDFLTRNRSLPHETRQYVSIIGPQIAGLYPSNRSQADLMVMNHQIGSPSPASQTLVAAAQPSATARSVRAAWARRIQAPPQRAPEPQPVQVAEASSESFSAPPVYQPVWRPIAPVPRPRMATAVPSPAASGVAVSSVWASRLASAPPARAPSVLAAAAAPRPIQVAQARTRRFRLIEPAMAESVPMSRGNATTALGPRDWAIQVGAFGTLGQANEAAGSARSRIRSLLPGAQTEIAGVRLARSGAQIYRARLTGLSRDGAVQACERLSRGRAECMVISPDSRT